MHDDDDDDDIRSILHVPQFDRLPGKFACKCRLQRLALQKYTRVNASVTIQRTIDVDI